MREEISFSTAMKVSVFIDMLSIQYKKKYDVNLARIVVVELLGIPEI